MFAIKDTDKEDEDNESTTISRYFIASSRLKTDSTTDSDKTSTVTTPADTATASTSTPSTGPLSTQSIASTAKELSNAADSGPSGEEVSQTRRPVVNFGTKLLVNPNQKANKLLRHLRSAYEFSADISPAHYLMSDSSCAVFLSLKYHAIYGNYIYDTLNALRHSYQLQVLLVLVDHIEYQSALKELTRVSVRTNCTLMLCWSAEEAANYIDNYRHFANKSPDIIMGKGGTGGSGADTDYTRVVDALTCVKSINKTDAVSLISTFDTIDNIVHSDDDQLIICPGMAALKVLSLNNASN
ncbi:unnamed protein product [Oppiella nova]|uniref:ERCC1-like central domain-containing protein n=1 Tax=Oppiella nova TaxID=334625 RepID=A0A7R9QSA2_9ACAR|nr:unnamed protein product [Oppiella nova]CAG2172067.1 unnamed protein product [Oppiella nova]